MTASVRAVIMGNLVAMLGTLAPGFAGLVVERNRPELEAADRFPVLILVDDERVGADEAIDEDVYIRTILARPVVVGWVKGDDRTAAQAAADGLAVAVAALVGSPTAALGPGWIDTSPRPVISGAAVASVDAIASFQLPLNITYQHAAADPADPGF